MYAEVKLMLHIRTTHCYICGDENIGRYN